MSKKQHFKPRKPLKSNEALYVEERGGELSPVLLQKYAYRITESVKDTIKGHVKNDPVAKQYLPQRQELQILPDDLKDPIGDGVHTPVKGIIHRYPDRVLFMPANVCAVYCRYCFRREKVGPGSDILDKAERQAALEYIRNNTDIWEVILSGGDPLILSPKILKEIIEELNDIKHVRVIRIHTRVPIADPKRVTKDMIEALKSDKALYVTLHVNHAQELSDEVHLTLRNLHKAGFNLLSQSVLLKGVNDNADTLADLFRTLITLNVKPYYLHHPDKAPGTNHFRLTIAEGQKIVESLRGKLSGICLPTYMIDIPGGHGKVPLTPSSIQSKPDGSYVIIDPQGVHHDYEDS